MSAASLEAHVNRVDGGAPAQRYKPQPARGSHLGSPLEEVTLHLVGDPGHWHLVTRGLTELDAKESPNHKLSGWGFELTLRLEVCDDTDAKRSHGKRSHGIRSQGTIGSATSGSGSSSSATIGNGSSGNATIGNASSGNGSRGNTSSGNRKSGNGRFRAGAQAEEPEWAVDFLTNLAAYVWTSGNPFSAGHHVDLGGPMKLKTDSAITAAAIVRDPGLGAITTPYGRVEFLQVVGLTADELELCRSWSTQGVLGRLAAQDPMLVTRLGRRSLMTDPVEAQEIARRAAVDGSSLTELRVGSLRFATRRLGGSVLTMGAGAAAALGPALRRELVGPGAGFVVISEPVVAHFAVAERPGWHVEGDVVHIDVPLNQVGELAALFDGRTGQGSRPAWPRLHFRVVA